MSIYKGLSYTTKEINKTFKIKVVGIRYTPEELLELQASDEGFKAKRLNILVGVKGLIALVGVDLANSLLKRAFKKTLTQDKEVCKLRRDLKITFYNH